MRRALDAKNRELEEIMHDLEARLDDEEDRSQAMSQEKKKLQLTIKVCITSAFCSIAERVKASFLRRP